MLISVALKLRNTYEYDPMHLSVNVIFQVDKVKPSNEEVKMQETSEKNGVSDAANTDDDGAGGRTHNSHTDQCKL